MSSPSSKSGAGPLLRESARVPCQTPIKINARQHDHSNNHEALRRYDDAADTVRDLEAAGIPHDDISLMANNADNRYVTADTTASKAGAGAGTGASIGTVIGGGAGLLAGSACWPFPGRSGRGRGLAGLHPRGCGGGCRCGAASGGVIGAMTEAGVSPDHAQVYAEGVRRGGRW
jgi:hypothetical protein